MRATSILFVFLLGVTSATAKILTIGNDVIVYGTTTDNTTNDPNIQLATIIFSTGG